MGYDTVHEVVGKALTEASLLLRGEQKKVRVALTTAGSELGLAEVVRGGELAHTHSSFLEIILIGPGAQSSLYQVVADDEEHARVAMEELLQTGEIDAAVTMHYNFPLGVSTVGRVITPGRGKEVYLATTTGTSSQHRVESMIKNAVYGIAVAKAAGIQNPSVGILNVDGAKQVEKALFRLKENGYPLRFAESARVDKGVIFRGNDLLVGSGDVVVCDSLTGNLLMKVFSAFTTGGSYESLGYGYGPGVGEGMNNKIINIISRASGAPVIANALQYAGEMARGQLTSVFRDEWEKAKAAGISQILSGLRPAEGKDKANEEVKVPAKKVVDAEIHGVDVLEIEDALRVVWKAGFYGEAGMGCTGPVILVAREDAEQAKNALKEAGII